MNRKEEYIWARENIKKPFHLIKPKEFEKSTGRLLDYRQSVCYRSYLHDIRSEKLDKTNFKGKFCKLCWAASPFPTHGSFCMTVQRIGEGKITPHEGRMLAEAKVAELESKIKELECRLTSE